MKERAESIGAPSTSNPPRRAGRASRSRCHDPAHRRPSRGRPRQDPRHGARRAREGGRLPGLRRGGRRRVGAPRSRRAQPEVCLLDINMPGSGIAAAARITAALPDTAVVMLTVSRQDEDLFDALRAGASGYLLKGMDEDRIGDALHRVLNGEATLPGTLVARLVEEFRDREHRRVAVPEGPAARLTGREWDVLELIAPVRRPPTSPSGCSSHRPPCAATSPPFCASSASPTGRPPSSCSRSRRLRVGPTDGARGRLRPDRPFRRLTGSHEGAHDRTVQEVERLLEVH